ncbi:MAG: sigma-70 family RNA polymerase sigma factor [Candidatus Firestonebacteria bacterium]
MTEKEQIIGRIEDMYNAYAENIYYFLLTKLRSKPDAEEVLQNVFLNIADIKEKVLLIKEPRKYLFTAARNEAINYVKAGKNRRNDESLDELLFEPAGKTVNNEEALEIEKAVLKLPDDQRSVVIMKFYRGFTFEEIAEAMDIPPNTAASKIDTLWII